MRIIRSFVVISSLLWAASACQSVSKPSRPSSAETQSRNDKNLNQIENAEKKPVEEVRIFRSVETGRVLDSAAAAKCPQAPFVPVLYLELDLATVKTRSLG